MIDWLHLSSISAFMIWFAKYLFVFDSVPHHDSTYLLFNNNNSRLVMYQFFVDLWMQAIQIHWKVIKDIFVVVNDDKQRFRAWCMWSVVKYQLVIWGVLHCLEQQWRLPSYLLVLARRSTPPSKFLTHSFTRLRVVAIYFF